MPIQIQMPRRKADKDDGILCAWLVEEGDLVEAGTPLFEEETDKVVGQVTAPVRCRILALLVDEGDTVPVGDVVLEAEEAE